MHVLNDHPVKKNHLASCMFYRRVVLSKCKLMLAITITYYVDIISCYKLDTCFGISSHFQANVRLQTTVVAVIDVSLNAQKHIYKTRIINKKIKMSLGLYFGVTS